ncbi:MAG: hypothetical protein ABIJ46_01355 [bacterium]
MPEWLKKTVRTETAIAAEELRQQKKLQFRRRLIAPMLVIVIIIPIIGHVSRLINNYRYGNSDGPYPIVNDLPTSYVGDLPTHDLANQWDGGTCTAHGRLTVINQDSELILLRYQDERDSLTVRSDNDCPDGYLTVLPLEVWNLACQTWQARTVQELSIEPERVTGLFAR